MRNRRAQGGENIGEMLLSAEEVGELAGVSPRTVLTWPVKQIRVGPRLIRFRLEDVYAHLGIDNPNL